VLVETVDMRIYRPGRRRIGAVNQESRQVFGARRKKERYRQFERIVERGQSRYDTEKFMIEIK